MRSLKLIIVLVSLLANVAMAEPATCMTVKIDELEGEGFSPPNLMYTAKSIFNLLKDEFASKGYELILEGEADLTLKLEQTSYDTGEYVQREDTYREYTSQYSYNQYYSERVGRSGYTKAIISLKDKQQKVVTQKIGFWEWHTLMPSNSVYWRKNLAKEAAAKKIPKCLKLMKRMLRSGEG